MKDTDTTDAPCPAGQTFCSGSCVDTQSNHEHCGGCNESCEPAAVCSDGTCMLECPSGRTNCGGSCVSLSDDPMNCGSCGNECSGGEHADPLCEAGECAVDCHDGWCDEDGDGSCESSCTSEEEICNGVDDDSDTLTDEGFECAMGAEEEGECGNCGRRSRTCSGDCTWGSWSSCSGEGCRPGDEQDCRVCGYQTCSSSCEWGECGNDGLEKWQRCNDCGVQYCNGDGRAWGSCVGPFDPCPDGGVCDSSGYCPPPCTANWQPCSDDSECCSNDCCNCHNHGYSDCWPDGNYDIFCNNPAVMNCSQTCLNVCNF